MNVDGFLFRTKPYAHQLATLKSARDAEVFPFLHEQGTGKSFVVVAETGDLWGRGRIDAVVIVAPNGVHRQWVTKQYEEHCAVPWRGGVWRSAGRLGDRKRWEATWDPKFVGLRVFSFNVEAFSRTGGRAAKELRRILNAMRVYLAVDESSWIKSPGARRTRTLCTQGKHAAYRRILTGTPITNNPLDLYAQFRFLDWSVLGWDTFAGFKSHYAEWEKRRTSRNRQGWYEELIGYKNQAELVSRVLGRFPGCRVLKKDCLDLPPKVYETRPVELTREQRRLYDALAEDGIARLSADPSQGGAHVPSDRTEALWALLVDEEGVVRGRNQLVLLMRLQQIVGGFVTDESELTREVPGGNPKLEALVALVGELDGKAIIWARFRPEIAAIAFRLQAEGYRVVEYHGGVGTDERTEAVDAFQNDPGVRFFVGQPRSGGLGLTLTAARTVVYYSQDFSYEGRAQSEDRAHRIGQTRSVLYVTLCAEDTVDERVADALAEKREMAALFDGGAL